MSQTNSRGFRLLPTTAPTRWCRVRARTWNRLSPRAALTESAAPGWTRVTPSIPSCSSPRSTNSNPTQGDLNSPSRRLPLVCNRTGAVLTAATPLDAQYWRRHSRQPVQFAESVRTVAQLGCSVLMEIGPQPILTAAAMQVWPEYSATPRAIASARKGVDARLQITEAVAAAYVAGLRPDFRYAAPSTTPQTRTAHVSVPAPSLLAQDLRHPHRRRRRSPASWVSRRISPPGTSSTPVGCPSNPSPGCRITSSMAPWWFRAPPTQPWRLQRCRHRRRCATSTFMNRSS